MHIETLMARMSVLLARIAVPANFSLGSDTVTFNKTLTSWLSDPTVSFPNGGIVGLCCSSLLSLQFRDESLEDDGLNIEIRRFLLATSLSRSGWQGGWGELKQGEIGVAGQGSGYRLIKRLDRTLTPQFLAKCDRDTCQILFLLVLGAVLGMGYALSLPESPQIPEGLSPELQQSPTLWLAIKEHLCQMLAHHLIHLGSMLGIKIDTQLGQRIIDTATNRWDKLESFIWADSKPFCYGRPREPREYAATSERYFRPPPSRSRPYWEEPPPPPLPSIDCLVPISHPEVSRLQSPAVDGWSQNPSSYLDMVDVPEENVASKTPQPEHTAYREDIYSATPPQGRKSKVPAGPIVSSTEPTRTSESTWGEGSETRRRSVWLVRPYDAGPEHGKVNVYAKLRGDRNAGDFRLFV